MWCQFYLLLKFSTKARPTSVHSFSFISKLMMVLNPSHITGSKTCFYCVNTSYPMDNMLNRSAQTGPPNVRKRRPVFPPAGRSSHCTRQVACRTSFLSRQADVIASFSFLVWLGVGRHAPVLELLSEVCMPPYDTVAKPPIPCASYGNFKMFKISVSGPLTMSMRR